MNPSMSSINVWYDLIVNFSFIGKIFEFFSQSFSLYSTSESISSSVMNTGMSTLEPQMSFSTMKYNGACGVLSQYKSCVAILTSALLEKKTVEEYEVFTAAPFTTIPVFGSTTRSEE